MVRVQKKFTEHLKTEEEFYFQWHITERCNKSCKHCYQNNLPTSELPVSELLSIVDKMEEAVCKWERKGTLSLTGGEPFIRQNELYALMNRLDSSEYFAYYDILSNGSLISENEAKKLSQHPRLRRVQVSLEGATAETNDAVRGNGSFNSTITAIQQLQKAGVNVSVMTTITKFNKDEIPALIKLLSEEGVRTMALERLIPEGAGANLTDQILSPEKLRQLYEDIYCIASNGSPIRILLHRPLFALLAPDDQEVGALCSAGNNALTIMPDGTLYPCRRLPIPIGNILTDGLFKVWYGSEVLWKLRNPDNLTGKCRECELITQCRGCRAMAYFTTKDYMAEDPQCWK